MWVSKKSIYGRHAYASHRGRTSSHDVLSTNTTSDSTHVFGDPIGAPLPYSTPAMPKMRRPYSAMAANQLSTDLFRPPLARTGSSSIGHQLPRSTLSVDARSSQELPSEESLRDGTVGPARSNRSGFLASSPAGHALRKQRRPLSASTISSAFPSFTAWKTPDTPPFPFQHKQEQHHHQQEQPQHPSSPPPPQRHPPQSPSPEPDVPQGDTTSLSSSTEVAHTGVRWSLGRQSQLLYAFKIAGIVGIDISSM